MPTYEYQCSACGHKFEKFQSITADPIKECPECHKKKVRRLIGTGAGIIFKGSGFYITDYRSDSYRSGASKDSGPVASPSTSSDAKPATSTPAATPAAGPAAKTEPKKSKAPAKAAS